jgi:hypothetical protein
MSRDRRGRFTAERTTKTTREVTERITVEDDDTITSTAVMAYDGAGAVLAPALGWDPGPITPRHDYLAQRRTQQQQALGLLVMWDASSPPGEPVPGWLIRQAVTILRAGPGATPLELTMGRSI